MSTFFLFSAGVIFLASSVVWTYLVYIAEEDITQEWRGNIVKITVAGKNKGRFYSQNERF